MSPEFPQGKPTSAFPDKKTADDLTHDTHQTGTPFVDRSGKKTYRKKYQDPVGEGPNGGKQHEVKVHEDKKGCIHGHPCGPES